MKSKLLHAVIFVCSVLCNACCLSSQFNIKISFHMIVTITEKVYPSLRLHSLIGTRDRLDRYSIEPDPSGPGQHIYEVHYGILRWGST